MSGHEARAALLHAGFRVNAVVSDSLAPEGQVFSQSPGGGAVTPLGTSVTIYVSTGEPAQVTVPRVVGLSRSDAEQALASLGLVANIVKVDTDDPKLVGVVLAQDPHSQTQVVQGSSITILVGREPKGDGGGGKGNGGGGGGGGG